MDVEFAVNDNAFDGPFIAAKHKGEEDIFLEVDVLHDPARLSDQLR